MIAIDFSTFSGKIHSAAIARTRHHWLVIGSADGAKILEQGTGLCRVV